MLYTKGNIVKYKNKGLWYVAKDFNTKGIGTSIQLTGDNNQHPFDTEIKNVSMFWLQVGDKVQIENMEVVREATLISKQYSSSVGVTFSFETLVSNSVINLTEVELSKVKLLE